MAHQIDPVRASINFSPKIKKINFFCNTEPCTSDAANGNRKNDENGDNARPNDNKMRRKARGCRGGVAGAAGAVGAAGTAAAGNERQLRKPRLKMHQNKKDEDLVMRQLRMMQNEVNNGLRSCEPGRELEVLHRCLRPDHHFLWYKCIEVKKDLVNSLCRLYPLIRLEVFGSTVMGMAFKGFKVSFDSHIYISNSKLIFLQIVILISTLRCLQIKRT